jgi:hypothetical protein
MLYKRQIKNTNLVSENRNLFISTWNTHWGFNTASFPLFYDYVKKGRDAVFRLFRQMGILLIGWIFGVCFTLEENHTNTMHIHVYW